MSSASLHKVDNRAGEAPNRPGFTIWMTGLSGAGKTTLAAALTAALSARWNLMCFRIQRTSPTLSMPSSF